MKRSFRRSRSTQIWRRLSMSDDKSMRQRVLPHHQMVEPLEQRRMLAIFLPVYPGTTTDNGTEHREANVPLNIVFAGGETGFGYDGSVTASQITDAMNQILSSD